jgi:hypothetical protein
MNFSIISTLSGAAAFEISNVLAEHMEFTIANSEMNKVNSLDGNVIYFDEDLTKALIYFSKVTFFQVIGQR